MQIEIFMNMIRILKYLILFLSFIYSCKTDIKKPTGFFPIKEYGKWGYINSEGKTIIKCQFDGVGQFSEGLAAVLFDSIFGFIDTTGKIVIKPQFRTVEDFSDGMCYVTVQIKDTIRNAYINKEGTIVFYTNADYIRPFKFGRALVSINNKLCFLNKRGEVCINTPHEIVWRVNEFNEGLARIVEGNGDSIGYISKYIDTTGKEILKIKGASSYGDFSEGLALINNDDKKYYVDKNGKVKINLENQELVYFDFKNGYAQASTGGRDSKCGFIDKTGKIVIPIMYLDVLNFSEGIAAVKDKEGWCFINTNGKLLIEAKFEAIDYDGFKNGLCYVQLNRRWGYINMTGEFVWQEQYGIEYGKLDLSKWELDTLETNKPSSAEKIVGYYNPPRRKSFPSINRLTINIDTIDLTVFKDKYFANKIYLINASKDTFKIAAQSGRIKLIQQAKNAFGEWQDIENYYNDWCGNSYHTIILAPKEYQVFATPIFKGKLKTELRFKLELENDTIYSNAYKGRINLGQFLDPHERDKTGIGVWTF